jgi:mRNA-degrading endonuclease RelE of RelBE toxin-antitoxin system
MIVKIYTHPEFEHQFKRYKKKYHSLVSDFQVFLASIKDNPYQGSSLGKGIRKVRFGIADKGGGKSGGMRVITFTLNKVDDETINITLLYLYDKSEMGNVSDKFLAYLIGQY